MVAFFFFFFRCWESERIICCPSTWKAFQFQQDLWWVPPPHRTSRLMTQSLSMKIIPNWWPLQQNERFFVSCTASFTHSVSNQCFFKGLPLVTPFSNQTPWVPSSGATGQGEMGDPQQWGQTFSSNFQPGLLLLGGSETLDRSLFPFPTRTTVHRLVQSNTHSVPKRADAPNATVLHHVVAYESQAHRNCCALALDNLQQSHTHTFLYIQVATCCTHQDENKKDSFWPH